MEVTLANEGSLKELSSILSILNTPHYKFSEAQPIVDSIKAGLCWVVQEQDQIVGVLMAREIEASFEIVALAILPHHYGKGAGARLIRAAESEAKKRSHQKIWCWSLTRYSAEPFYRKMGFEEVFLLRKQFFGEDCWFFGKVVASASSYLI